LRLVLAVAADPRSPRACLTSLRCFVELRIDTADIHDHPGERVLMTRWRPCVTMGDAEPAARESQPATRARCGYDIGALGDPSGGPNVVPS
jgi:hypothetical protein